MPATRTTLAAWRAARFLAPASVGPVPSTPIDARRRPSTHRDEETPPAFLHAVRSPILAPHRTRRMGLTLLELLAVVVILAIVWAFVFPATDAVRRSALRRQALSDAQSLATAVTLYRDAYGQWPLQDQTKDAAQDIVYGTNIIVTTGVTLLDHAALIRALTPRLVENPANPRQQAFLEIDSNQLQDGCFTDPWSTTNSPSPYVVTVDANGDGWIGARKDETVSPIEVKERATGGRTHDIPAVQETAYVFSWSDTADPTNRVSTLRHQ